MRSILIILSLLLTGAAAAQPSSERVSRASLKVFLLAGQSNMQGQAVVDLDHEEHYNGGRGILARVLDEPALARRFGHLRDGRSGWVTRDDVWVWYRTSPTELKTGGLSVGFTGYSGEHHFGPELALGHVLGAHFDEPVLLIKTAWGGQSLFKDFRPPSAGGEIGPRYVQMLTEYREAIAKRGEVIDGAELLTPELAGMIWFQGWNDMIDERATAEYEDNLVHLVSDLRRDLGTPDLPVVIAETGNCANMKLRGAQAAAAERPEIADSSRFVATAQFLRRAEDSPNRTHGHHWFGNAASYLRVGEAMGHAMLELIGD